MEVIVSLNKTAGTAVLAFADITVDAVLTPGGEPSKLNCRGFRIIAGAPGRSNWVSVPSRSYEKDGKKQYADFFKVDKGAMAIIAASILKKYNELAEASK